MYDARFFLWGEVRMAKKSLHSHVMAQAALERGESGKT